MFFQLVLKKEVFYKKNMAFLVFEGVDGSGKSSLIELFLKELEKRRLPFIQSKEPGGTPIGKQIRELLLNKKNLKLNPLSETLLYYADRKQHIQDLIVPALKEKKWVILDRYWASTSAYQCGGRAVSQDFVETLKKEICGDCQPHLWILLDLPVEQSMKRLKLSTGNQLDRMEIEAQDFHQRVRDYYLKLAKEEPTKWLILDSSQKSSQLLEQLISHLKNLNLL